MNKLAIVLTILYILLCIIVIDGASFFEKEDYIDGQVIKNVCDVYRALVVDDIRGITAPISLLFIFPLFYTAAKKRFKSAFFNAVTLALLAYWLWRFFIRLIVCI
ncbi:Inner membrane protein YjeO [Photorhabdus australis subsp. thailandensis]|uniref:Inner membrane protein YjeO n=1 Tax=Photorhabdus australis subsp. thailandensis TaxID=2805096 RepID=A0A1C0U9T2_9GAMM|nr:YjeO family protein [Photorhabdus australis]OCQ54691.1 Inner membrane protein YjeO [Photorhabdus australis subsp. thailandensis]